MILRFYCIFEIWSHRGNIRAADYVVVAVVVGALLVIKKSPPWKGQVSIPLRFGRYQTRQLLHFLRVVLQVSCKRLTTTRALLSAIGSASDASSHPNPSQVFEVWLDAICGIIRKLKHLVRMVLSQNCNIDRAPSLSLTIAKRRPYLVLTPRSSGE